MDIEATKVQVKQALTKLFAPTVDESGQVVALTPDEIAALRVFLGIGGLFPVLDANDRTALENVTEDVAARQALVTITQIAVDRWFSMVYGV